MGREREHGRDKFLFVCTSSSGPIDRLTHISSVRVWCYPSQPPSSPSSSSSSLPPPWVSHFLYDLFPCYLLCFLTIANEGSYYSASSSSPPDCRDSDEQAIRDTRTEMKGRRRRGRELVALPWRPAMGTRGGGGGGEGGGGGGTRQMPGEMLPPDYRRSRASSRNTYDDSL